MKVQALLNQGVHQDSKGRFDRTPLFSAAINGHSAVIGILTSHGANVNAQERNGDTPLYRAVLGGHSSAVNALIDAGADIHLRTSQSGNPTLLHLAAEHGHADIAAKLTMAGIDPEDRPRGSGHTALSLATAMGHSKVVSAIKKASQTLHDSQECRNENHP